MKAEIEYGFQREFLGNTIVMAENPIACIVHNMTLFETIEPVLSESPVPYDILIPTFSDPAWQAMAIDTVNCLIEHGYHPKLIDKAPSHVYRFVLSAIPYDDKEIYPKAMYNIRFNYGLAKETWNFDIWNLNYDLILCYGQYDESFLSTYAKTVQVGPIRFANMQLKPSRTKDNKRKYKLLYLPTYGSACSIEMIKDTLIDLQDEFDVTIRLHHGTTFLEPKRVEMAKEITAAVFDHKASLVELLADADVVLSDGSGAIFDAIATNTPVVVFQPVSPEPFEGKDSLENQIIVNDVVPNTKKKGEIRENLIKAIEDEEYTQKREELAQQLFAVRGKESINRCWEILNKLLIEDNSNNPYFLTHSRLKRKFNEVIVENSQLKIARQEIENNYNEQKSQLFIDIKKMKEEVKSLNEQLSTKEAEIKLCNSELSKKKVEIETLTNELSYTKTQIQNLSDHLNRIISSRYWKLTSIFYRLLQRTGINYIYRILFKKEGNMFFYLNKAYNIIKRQGFSTFCYKLKNRVKDISSKKLNTDQHQETLNQILERYPSEKIVVFLSPVEWNIPLFQRPQHIAMNMAKQGFLYFFCTPNVEFESINGFEQVVERCYITNRMDLLSKIDRSKVWHVYSTDTRNITIQASSNDRILYEYIDEIHENITGQVPPHVWERHQKMLEDEQVIVVATATKLYDDVLEKREKNCALITNGVEYEHFSKKFAIEEAPEIVKGILRKNKPIIGYFGAFAKWFDYELVKKLAVERPEYELLLIGVDYDGSMKEHGIDQLDNVTVPGAIDYKELPRYASWFDVSTIPFCINDITISTSPIKLFEYMAMGKAIVTTDMPECRKYQSVLIGRTHDEFIQKIDEAIKLNSRQDYQELLKKEALENTWAEKAREIARLL